MDRKTPFGRALASVRAEKGLTVAGLADAIGMSAGTVSNLEVGKRGIDSDIIADIDAALGLSIDERRRLASGWGSTGADGGASAYDVRPSCPAGHHAAAMVSVFAGDLSPISWGRIAAIVETELHAKAARVAA